MSKRSVAVEVENDTALILSGKAALARLDLLLRAIDRRKLWPEISYEAQQASTDAHRDLAHVRRALEVGHDVAKARREQAGGEL